MKLSLLFKRNSGKEKVKKRVIGVKRPGQCETHVWNILDPGFGFAAGLCALAGIFGPLAATNTPVGIPVRRSLTGAIAVFRAPSGA